MTVFVDTSAIFAILDEDDSNHPDAQRRLRALRGEDLVTHTYVVVESLALIGRRLPWRATRTLIDAILPILDVEPVSASLHGTALAAYRESPSAHPSFVDHTSFAFMRMADIGYAFAYDRDFVERGFAPPPIGGAGRVRRR